MDRQTETGQNRNIGYGNQLSVATISLRHLEVALCSTHINCVGGDALVQWIYTTPLINTSRNILLGYIHWTNCSGIPKSTSQVVHFVQEHVTARRFGKLREMGKSSGAEHS